MIDFADFVQTEGQPIYLQIMRYIKQGLAAGTIADWCSRMPGPKAAFVPRKRGAPPCGRK